MDRGSEHCTGGSDQKHSKEEEMQEGKVIGEAVQIAEERRELKSKGERQKYAQMNAVSENSKDR